MSRALEVLEAYLDALREVRDLMPALEQKLRAIPDEAPVLGVEVSSLDTSSIEASPLAVELLLPEEIRQDLTMMARYDVPSLEVTKGAAVLSWSYAPERQLMQNGIRVLTALRNRPVHNRLVREAWRY